LIFTDINVYKCPEIILKKGVIKIMQIPKFDPKELEVVGKTPATPFSPELKIFNSPVSMRDAYNAMTRRRPVWQVSGLDSRIFTPRIVPDNVARAFVLEGKPFDMAKEGGGKDMFGIDWEFIPVAGGSMVRPGKPFMEDATEWYDKVVWPDIDLWDWEGSAKLNNGTYLTEKSFNLVWFQTGWYERLISFMDFEGAIMAMIDEDQKEAVKELFHKLSDLYIRIFDKYLTYYEHIDGFYIHDDWGSQKETFFSPDTAAEVIVPAMKRVTDFIHSKGKVTELHSCGQLFKQVPNIIAAGWDAWAGQEMNDTHKIYEMYGDKIMIGVLPEKYDINTTSEAEQRRMAREYADKFCKPEKPSFLNFMGLKYVTPAFQEELYKQSRINYSR
jgi:hypothetical protein